MKDLGHAGRTGFTLIELLIVVAIIAILAAIAVPNFLEAQTRAKVSRAKADERTMATAIESYAVDWNMAPVGPATRNPTTCPDCVGWMIPDGMGNRNAIAQAMLTTPVAYITGILDDPFKTTGQFNKNQGTWGPGSRLFQYQEITMVAQKKADLGNKNNTWLKAYEMGYTWGFYSVGPARNVAGTFPNVLRGVNPTNPVVTYFSYDPSNGTMSAGWVIRTNKGVFTNPGT